MRPIALLILALIATTANADPVRSHAAGLMAQAATLAATGAPDLVIPAEPEIQPVSLVSYAEAYKLYKSERKPMVVMVGAAWCRYCPAVKAELMRMLKQGEFDDASLVLLDWDANRRDATSVAGRRPGLPYLRVYYTRDGRPKSAKAGSTKEIGGLLKQSNRLDAPPKKAARVEPVRQAVYCRSCSR
ncbi:thioredoxin domain-containing protein [Blastopirellula retiformator]|uniref:Thioredoxin domain-containing protein n=1 Tax=Blastopirellula retiformator TaxID=2527970 RepID=A0A5C5UWY4_9BACT|nr:hypothetical protein [Blastopirellula retiformator]TWT30698.1 hypothetical protein Enr8_42210 [Blastopirellula retiformator]